MLGELRICLSIKDLFYGISAGGLYDYIKIYLENLHKVLCFAIAKKKGILFECVSMPFYEKHLCHESLVIC